MILSYEPVLVNLIKYIDVEDLYYINKNICEYDAKLFYMFGVNANCIRMMLRDAHTIHILHDRYNLNKINILNISNKFNEFINLFDKSYLFSNLVSSEYRKLRYKFNYTLHKALKKAGIIEDIKLIDHILDSECLHYSHFHIEYLCRGLSFDKLEQYLAKYVDFTNAKGTIMPEGMIERIVESKLKRGIDIDPKYRCHINRNNCYLITKILAKCHFHLLKYFNVRWFISTGFTVQLSAYYHNNLSLLKAITENDCNYVDLDNTNNTSTNYNNNNNNKYNIPRIFEKYEYDRSKFLLWSCKHVECMMYMGITKEETIKSGDNLEVMLFEVHAFDVIEKWYTREEIQECVNNYKYDILGKTILYLIENEYSFDFMRHGTYRFRCDDKYFELVQNYVDIDYIDAFEFILKSNCYEPYLLRLVVDKLEDRYISLVSTRYYIKSYIKHDHHMIKWFNDRIINEKC